MGCDIHLFSEVKIDGRWYCHGKSSVERWYGLFAKMAGVRNSENITPVSEPKGLPEDISLVVKKYYEYWKLDAHSMSWLNRSEIKEVENWLEEQYKKNGGYHCPEENWGYCLGGSFGDFDYPMFEDVRFVFWFDN